MDELYRHESRPGPTATVELDPDTRSNSPVSPRLYGKFSEHLGWNVSHGLHAQLLFNPTFGRWRFRAATPTEDGGYVGTMDPERRRKMVDEHAQLQAYPTADGLHRAVEDGLAFWWQRRGDEEAVVVSPDVGQARDRAQRVEIREPTSTDPRGLVQWLYLPLQRTRTFEYSVTIRARADTEATLTLALHRLDRDGTIESDLASVPLDVGDDWQTLDGTFTVSAADAPAADELVALSLTAVEACNVVVDRLTLYPDDHVGSADPDVVRFLRDADLPVMRWPGGNFVSDYDWRDGVGPRPARPTTTNPAWGGIESNLFGTGEFVALCEAVGCEPMLCVNTGTGTPSEAAQWVEYCNGDASTPMGRLRAEHGSPEPFGVEYWEVGNELYGQYQPNWTTPDGYVDRFKRFRSAMLDADPDIHLVACGTDGEWNERLLAEASSEVRAIATHPLIGAQVDGAVDLDRLYHTLMGATEALDVRLSDLAARMRDVGIEDPRLAISELQITVSDETDSRFVLSPPWHGSRYDGPSSALPGKKSITEAIWDASIIHNCLRQDGTVELVTHTGTVNHGGGLQKRRERVWADPCHYGHAMGAVLTGKTPVGVDVACETIAVETPVGAIETVDEFPVLDVVAAVDDAELAVMLVHRGSGVGDLAVRLDPADLSQAQQATRTTLTGESMASENTLEEPDRVVPERETVDLDGGILRVTVPEYGLTSLVLPR